MSLNAVSHRLWHDLSVRHKLMVLSLLPLLVVLPLLLGALVVWGNSAFDRLLITKVRSDLAVAHGHFVHVFVDRATRRPVAIPPRLRDALAGIVVAPPTATPSSG